MSIEQIENLNITFKFSPGEARCTCACFGYHDEVLPRTTSGHVVLDLLQYVRRLVDLKGTSFMTSNDVGGINYAYFSENNMLKLLNSSLPGINKSQLKTTGCSQSCQKNGR